MEEAKRRTISSASSEKWVKPIDSGSDFCTYNGQHD